MFLQNISHLTRFFWTQDWTVTCVVNPNTAADITSFTVSGQVGNSTINAASHIVTFHMPYGSNVTALTPTIGLSPGATISPTLGTAKNFTSTVIYTVTAQNGNTQTWTVTCTVDPNTGGGGGGGAVILPAPIINPNGGTFTSAQTVTITGIASGGTAYYTTDGSNPTLSSTVYNGAFSVSKTETVKAAVYEGSWSSIASATFTVKPVLSVILTDIDGHWAQSSIEQLVAMGAITGYPDGTFQPDKYINRAEFATMLVKALKLDPKTEPLFPDTQGHWAQSYISTGAANGIIKGYDAAHFGPEDLITREQMAAMVVRAAKLAIVSSVLTFTDTNQIDQWAMDDVSTVVQDKIVTGYPDNTFKPLTFGTRAEAVTLIVRIIK